MQFLSFVNQCSTVVPKVVGNGSIVHTLLTTSSSTSSVTDITSLVGLISDAGISIVISAVMVFFIYRYLRSLMKRDNQLFNSIIPKLDGIESELTRMESDISKLVSNHNAHSNQMLKGMEKEQDDMRDMIAEEQNQLRTIMSQIAAVQSNVEITLRIIAACNNYTLPKKTELKHDAIYDVPAHTEDVEPSDDTKK
jgi:hypothetical protein